jgi:hypothetical protein
MQNPAQAPQTWRTIGNKRMQCYTGPTSIDTNTLHEQFNVNRVVVGGLHANKRR